MPEHLSAGSLLREAGAIFDSAENGLAQRAKFAWCTGFDSGGRWMCDALATLRGETPAMPATNLSALGMVKYGVAVAASLLAGAIILLRQQYWALPVVVFVFYAVEAQMVFLFPLAIDGRVRVFRESLEWTSRAGGTWSVMRIVLPIAGTMLFGGFVGRGFIRSWCVGCLAVVVWYERLRQTKASARTKLEIGTSQPLLVRRVALQIFGNKEAVRLFYASDLHCRPISKRAVEQLVDAAREHAPDLILLGGDLADARAGLPMLTATTMQLAAIAPVWVVPGNHDVAVGLNEVRAAIVNGGGNWLGNDSVLIQLPGRVPFHLDGEVRKTPRDGFARILCAHDPEITPAAVNENYQLVLAGHLHGGQCVVATWKERLFPGAWFYRWCGLRFDLGVTTLLVSRGLSDTLRVRWNCPREVLLCEVR